MMPTPVRAGDGSMRQTTPTILSSVITPSAMHSRRDVLKLSLTSTLPLPLTLLPACGGHRAAAPDGTATGHSGVDALDIDAGVRPQDDLYRHANGKWLDRTEIPAENASWGTFNEVAERTLGQLRDILARLAATDPAPGSSERIAADFHASFMDEATLERRGLSVVEADLRRVDALRGAAELAGMMAHCLALSVPCPLAVGVQQDGRDASRHAAVLFQSGLGLPDRSYYAEAALAPLVERYQAHIATVMTLAGLPDAASQAASVVALERQLAAIQWSAVDNRDQVRTYNPRTIAQLKADLPAFDWDVFLRATDLATRTESLVVMQPSYLRALEGLLRDERMDAWRSYFRWQILRTASPYLDARFAAADFAFHGTVLAGVPVQPPRWKRAIDTLNRIVGDCLGRVYVRQHFRPADQARIEALVEQLRDACRQAIEGAGWLGEPARRRALRKLDAMAVKVGAPRAWRDYAEARIRPDDLWGNVVRAQALDQARDIAKLGRPVDRDQWYLPPQSVNAYYNPSANEIVFPAAILQPPFFDAGADDAANYGAIGSIIGHEMSHAFDDQGSRYDEFGNLSEWWSAADRTAYDARVRGLVAQYGRQSPVAGHFVDGELTLGENIADNVGLQLAFDAYRRLVNAAVPASAESGADASIGAEHGLVRDGYTGAQRFYMSHAHALRAKMREAALLRRLKVDPHAPAAIRVDVAMGNQAGFHAAFDVRPGDRLYLAPAGRVVVWAP